MSGSVFSASRAAPIARRSSSTCSVMSARERLLAEFARGVGVGVSDPTVVLSFYFVRPPGGPHYLREVLSEPVDALNVGVGERRVGEFIIKAVDEIEVRPRGDDVAEVVREDVRGRLQHRLLGLLARLRPPRPRRPRERLVDQLLRPGRRRKIFEVHTPVCAPSRISGVSPAESEPVARTHNISTASSTEMSPRLSAPSISRVSSSPSSSSSSAAISSKVTFSESPVNSAKSVPSARAVPFLTR